MNEASIALGRWITWAGLSAAAACGGLFLLGGDGRMTILAGQTAAVLLAVGMIIEEVAK